MLVVVLFDLEGTLVGTIEDDEEAIHKFRTRTKEKLVELGIPSRELEGSTTSAPMRNIAVRYVKEHFSREEADGFHAEMDRFQKGFELSWAEHSEIFPDTLPALGELKSLGCRMGIVTNTSREAADRELSVHGIEAFFEIVITREDMEKLKPDPEGLLIASRRMKAQDFLFVGDLIHDSRAARRAGGISIMIERKSSRRPQFRADHIVQSLTEIPTLIRHLTGTS
jgi:HAD superfamily hydrolase (TIGR01549 family)